MKKARKTVRKSWSSFNQQMRRSSANANNVVASASSLNKDDYGGDGDGKCALKQSAAQSLLLGLA